MTFAQDEGSVQSSAPREGIEIIFPAFTERIATGDQDVPINGFTYKAAPGVRGEIVVDVAGIPGSLQLTLPVGQRCVQRYLQNAIPPRQITVNVWRLQQVSGQVQRVWTGYWTSLSIDGNLAKVLVPARLGFELQRRLPTITVDRTCPHVLYDANCTVNRAAFVVTTTVALVEGARITLAATGGVPDQWEQFGELVHVASGERMTISSQVGAVVEMQFPIAELKDGDTVQVYAGCDHGVGTCHTKFLNQQNFGGLPQLPATNPFVPGSGIYSTTSQT